jgi:hypothetical protein
MAGAVLIQKFSLRWQVMFVSLSVSFRSKDRRLVRCVGSAESVCCR